MGVTRWLALALLAVVPLGCSSPFGVDEKRVLAGARQQWAARPFPDYRFETRRDCFCRSEEIGPARITVRQGVIRHVMSIETGEAVGYPSSIAVRYEERILDAGILYVISAVGAAQ